MWDIRPGSTVLGLTVSPKHGRPAMIAWLLLPGFWAMLSLIIADRLVGVLTLQATSALSVEAITAAGNFRTTQTSCQGMHAMSFSILASTKSIWSAMRMPDSSLTYILHALDERGVCCMMCN